MCHGNVLLPPHLKLRSSPECSPDCSLESHRKNFISSEPHQNVHWNLTKEISNSQKPHQPFYLYFYAEFCQFFKHFGIFFFNKMLAGFLQIIPLRRQHRSLMTAYNQPEIHHRIAGLDFQSLIGCLPDIVIRFAFVKNVDHLFNNFQESAAVVTDELIQ